MNDTNSSAHPEAEDDLNTAFPELEAIGGQSILGQHDGVMDDDLLDLLLGEAEKERSST